MPPKGGKKGNLTSLIEKPSNVPPAPSVPKNSISGSSGVTISVHPIWPDMQFTQGELFFECTLFLYSVLALFLQYLNIYKTLWWLPKSYWHYSLKFHLINPYFLSCVGLLLGWRVTMCFWKTITDIIATLSINQSQFVQSCFMVIEYAIIKTPLMTLIITSFLFSFTRVCHDFPPACVLYFGFPVLVYVFVFYREIIFWIYRFGILFGQWRRNEIDISLFAEKLVDSPPAQIDLDSVLHMCSDNPAQIREEVAVLIDDLVLRIKKSYFAGLSTTFLSILLPCVFVPFKTSQGIPQTILINVFWECQLGIVVALTAFSLYMTYLLPLNYLDLLHRAAIHLGCWQQIEGPKIGHTGSMNACPLPWNEFCLYADGETVQMPDGRCYRAKSSALIKTVAAQPDNYKHSTFFKCLKNPNNLINALCLFEFSLIFIQFWMLVLTNDWQHIVTFVLLMFANYLLFAKLFKDKIILGRIYEPSQEDLLLMQQLQRGMMINEEKLAMVGHPIKVDLDTNRPGKHLSITGNLMTIDPTSQSLVLAKFKNGSELVGFEWIPSTSVERMEKLEEIDENTKKWSKSIENLFDEHLGMIKINEIEEDEKQIKERCLKIVNYLKSHHIDVIEKKGGVFEICGIVKFEKPYNLDNFYCDIPIVLQRILKLVNQME